MSVVSGIATANGVSSLLNGRFDSASDQKRARDASPSPPGKALRIDASISRIVERMRGGAEVTLPTQSPASGTAIAKGSGKYMRFVDAVQALRLNTADAARMSPARVEELKEAAKEVFDIRSGVPREQRPAEAFEEQRIREAEREAIEQAERARAENAERVMVALDGEQTEQQHTGTEFTGAGSAPESSPAHPSSADAGPKGTRPHVPEVKVNPTAPSGAGSSPEPARASEVDTGAATPASTAPASDRTASVSTLV
ncbi:MAG: hypothetical protein AAF479_13375 [Pseudomonadota bacterium]